MECFAFKEISEIILLKKICTSAAEKILKLPFSDQKPDHYRSSNNRSNCIYRKYKIKPRHLRNGVANQHNNSSKTYGSPEQNLVV